MKHVIPGFEKRKVFIDLLKHFSTLSIGVLALSAAFLGNFSQLNASSGALVFAVSCFFCVVVSSSIAKYILVANIEEVPRGSFSLQMLRICIYLTMLGFFGGAGSFVYLVVQNT